MVAIATRVAYHGGLLGDNRGEFSHRLWRRSAHIRDGNQLHAHASRLPPRRRGAPRPRGGLLASSRVRSEPTHQATSLSARREAINSLVGQIDALPEGVEDETLLSLVREGLSRGVLAPLAHARGGIDSLARQALHEYRRFAPSAASNAADRSHAVSILLLQCLDLLWWGDADEYADDAQLEADQSLLDLVDERRRGRVSFSFAIAPRGLTGRVRDVAQNRLTPHRRPRGPGLRYTRARPAMVGVLNEVAERVAAGSPGATPRIWVTSITRTTAHQAHLSSLGFSALTPSAHCSGWAADIDAVWFGRYGAPDVLAAVLTDYLSRGVLNVIDGTGAWHVCLNPEFAGRYGELER